ncbi:4789_t:CDS:1, partial [Paraglomus brasilianum]
EHNQIEDSPVICSGGVVHQHAGDVVPWLAATLVVHAGKSGICSGGVVHQHAGDVVPWLAALSCLLHADTNILTLN